MNIRDKIIIRDTFSRISKKSNENRHPLESKLALLNILALLSLQEPLSENNSKLIEEYSSLYGREKAFESSAKILETALYIMKGNQTLSKEQMELIASQDISNADICARILCEAIAINRASGKSINPLNEIINILKGKISQTIASGDLWNKIFIIDTFFSPSPQVMLFKTNKALSDYSIPANSYYPRLLILKTVLELSTTGSTEKQTAYDLLIRQLRASTTTSPNDLKMADILVSDKPDKIVAEFTLAGLQESSLWAGIIAIIVNSQNKELCKNILSEIKQNDMAYFWVERIAISSVEKAFLR